MKPQDFKQFVYNVRKTYFVALIAVSIFMSGWIVVAAMDNMPYFKAFGILTGISFIIILVCGLILDGISWHYKNKD